MTWWVTSARPCGLGHTLEGLEEREVRDVAGLATAGSGVVLTFAAPR